MDQRNTHQEVEGSLRSLHDAFTSTKVFDISPHSLVIPALNQVPRALTIGYAGERYHSLDVHQQALDLKDTRRSISKWP